MSPWMSELDTEAAEVLWPVHDANWQGVPSRTCGVPGMILGRRSDESIGGSQDRDRQVLMHVASTL